MDADVTDPCWVIARLARVLENSLTDLDLSLPQYRVLTILSQGSEGAAALAAKLAVKPASVTSVVDGLVARGLVERQADSEDRRKVSHVVSASGSSLLDRAREVTTGKLHEVSGHLDSADESMAWAAIDLWQQALRSYRTARLAERALTR